eukprot:SAG25_NODE_1126_length_3875_cov_18.200477_1_plen_86_part_10
MPRGNTERVAHPHHREVRGRGKVLRHRHGFVEVAHDVPPVAWHKHRLPGACDRGVPHGPGAAARGGFPAPQAAAPRGRAPLCIEPP